MIYELRPIYDHAKSFYKKAFVEEAQGVGKRLLSYNTCVATIDIKGNLWVRDTYSQTTLRHIKEFMQQNGFGLMTKKEIEDNFLRRVE